jgi:tetratricopeptide (TPR) repeat protein
LKARTLTLAAVLLGAAFATPAHARNFHVAGGIQYVVQGSREMSKGNEVDARRIYGKAIQQLNQGLQEDPDDLEAWDYLGVAYAEIDSAEKAGEAFNKGITATRAKGEERKKLLQRMIDNREHYWVIYFNKAIKLYQAAVDAAPSGGQPDSVQVLKAADAMRRAVAVNPENPRSYCNLAAFLANARRVDEALQTVDDGLKVAPGDSCLTQRKAQMAVLGGEKAAASGDYEAAAGPYRKMLESDPNNATAALRLGELFFQQGAALEDKAEKATDPAQKKELAAQAKSAFTRSASEGFGRYHTLKPDDRDGLYNYAVALSRAEDFPSLAKAAHQGVMAEPDSAKYHSFLSVAYRGLGIEDAASGHALLARILREGNKEADPAGFAKASAAKWGAASDAAKKLAELGPPEEVRTQTMGDIALETWFWYSKHRALIFTKGRIVPPAIDWSQLATAKAPAATPPKPAPRGKGSSH